MAAEHGSPSGIDIAKLNSPSDPQASGLVNALDEASPDSLSQSPGSAAGGAGGSNNGGLGVGEGSDGRQSEPSIPSPVSGLNSGQSKSSVRFRAAANEVAKFSTKLGLKTAVTPVAQSEAPSEIAGVRLEASYLDTVLKSEFQVADATDDDDANVVAKFTSDRKEKTIWNRIVEHRFFSGFFMFLTFYALFAPDLDTIYGDKTSKDVFTFITTVVVFLFVGEIFFQCMGKRGYTLAAYFWLDLVSLLSLLPETYFLQEAFSQQNLAAGRSTRLTRIIRVASRSSKAARLNRLSRIVRVAALMPRIQRLLGNSVTEDAAEKLLEKKLGRVFHFLDEDLDGLISRQQVLDVTMKLRAILGTHTNATWASKVSSQVSTSATTAFRVTDTHFKSLTDQMRNVVQSGNSPNGVAKATLEPAPPEDGEGENEHRDPTFRRTRNIAELMEGMMNYQLFKTYIMEDEVASAGLLRSCKNQIRSSNNMQNMTARNTEYIGVKVALCVLLLLFVLTLVEYVEEDESESFGLSSLDGLTSSRFPNATVGESISTLISEQVRAWTQQDYTDDWGLRRTILYLDLNYLTYCNIVSGSSCEASDTSNLEWGTRRNSLEGLDDMTTSLKRRWTDLLWVRYPSAWDADYTSAELEAIVTSVALIDLRDDNVREGVNSLLMTIVVIVIILTGIGLLTRDLTFLSKNLLKPLVELADEMESITRLQLAAVSAPSEPQVHAGTSEVRLLRNTFENMKKAIKSWGKYVPWPVVQLLLRDDAEAIIDVQEKEVSIYFSDIASFTTIVEGLPPEKSLLLLSRYFHDMSKIIDEFGGIVLEFIGDAIMSIYGAPVRNPDHATAAVTAAVRMLASLKAMNQFFSARTLPEVAIRCGVHTGPVLVGNMGFSSRMKYGAVGEHSNVPSHLEESNKNYETEMLISESTYKRLTPESFITRPVDVMTLVAGAAPEQIYQVMEKNTKDPNYNKRKRAAATHTEAMALYLEQDFAKAADQFDVAGAQFTEITGQADLPSSMLSKRCRSYAEKAPPPDWQGLWDRAEK